MKFTLLPFFFFLLSFASHAKAQNKPLKGLLVTGGGHHDYATQKEILTKELAKRVPVKWDILFEMDPGE